MTILRNKGGGNFGQPASSPEAAGDGPVSVAATAGDGDQDLATANAFSDNVSIARNRAKSSAMENGLDGQGRQPRECPVKLVG